MKEFFLTILRNRTTKTAHYRQAAGSLIRLLAAETAAQITLKPCGVQTPLSRAKGCVLAETVILIAILRSGLAMIPPFLNVSRCTHRFLRYTAR